MARIMHFEIHASDPERAMRFYREAFAWRSTPIAVPDYWIIETGEGPGLNGGLMLRRGPEPVEGQAVNAFVCTLGVDDLDASIAASVKAGGTIAMPRFAVPKVGYVAYLKDTEGNIFGVHQADPDAA